MKLQYDKPLIAMLLSILGAIPVGIFVEIMKFFHLTTVTFFQASSMMFIKEGSPLLGILSYIGYSAFLGLVMYHSPKILGNDYFVIKCLFISMFAESLLFIIFGTLVGNIHLVQNTSGNYVHACAAAMGGLSRGFLIKRYLFKQYEAKV
ncbi:hypothetical protein Desaci_4316 [Desulfosporosinus acidiphilus SJ4]|uniref:Uncharacterized protein n=1 Tax=Desulfosporosinus acidiphilus (strain DSM 22704 / JCM 16185 / SJ4) TaxID=646529 RepID=I4DBJ2_DESAJ|nr:hypothetical protein [Desulfosporosinus acidiphilus]AFM43166.1 hypothetical protein Desaci_4316 [Desulfosporosinus acidiphilus SJ4]